MSHFDASDSALNQNDLGLATVSGKVQWRPALSQFETSSSLFLSESQFESLKL